MPWFPSALEHNNMRQPFCQHLFANFLKIFLVLIIEHAMAKTLKVGVNNLLTEFLADALILLGALETAGAIAAGALQTLPDGSDNFLIFI